MGLDGGTTMTRTDILRRSSWRVSSRDPHSRSTRGGQVSASYVAAQECVSPADLAAAKWSTCALTGEPLQEPIVACHLGKLYNRESVVQLLLARNGVFQDEAARYRYENQLHFISDFDHMRTLKDVFALHPTAPLHPAEVSGKVVKWVCPITRLAAGGLNHFSALPTCGHAFASKALRELSDTTCPTCSLAYPHSEVVPLNGTTEQMEETKGRLKLRRSKEKGGKGEKRRKGDGGERSTKQKT